MSEYQFYEFLAIDRRLSDEQMRDLRTISTRAKITPTSLTNSYSYGSFRGDPDALIEEYFDAHVYIANWGSHTLMFGFPASAVDVEALQPYQVENAFKVEQRGDRVIVTLEAHPEDSVGGWVDEDEGPEWMSRLVRIRDDLMAGDLRPAYIAWLGALQHYLPIDVATSVGSTSDDDDACDDEDFDDGIIDMRAQEPPAPPGLTSLSGPLAALAEFLDVGEDLLAVAAEASRGLEQPKTTAADQERWVADLPASAKDDVIRRLLDGDSSVAAELKRRFAAAMRPDTATSSSERRTVGQLLAAARSHMAERKKKESEAVARERRRLAEEAARAKEARLRSMVGRDDDFWQQVESLVATKKPEEYDRATVLLKDLRDLADRENRRSRFEDRLRALRDSTRSKSSFQRRLKDARLI